MNTNQKKISELIREIIPTIRPEWSRNFWIQVVGSMSKTPIAEDI